MTSLNEIDELVNSLVSDINLVQLTKEEAELLRDERIAAFNERCVFVKQKHTAWIVIQRMNRSTGGQFLAPSMFETEALARAYAAMFSDVVSVQQVEWEE